MIFGDKGCVAIEAIPEPCFAGQPLRGCICIWVNHLMIGDVSATEFLAPSIMFFKRFIKLDRPQLSSEIRLADPAYLLDIAQKVCYREFPDSLYGLSSEELWRLLFIPQCAPFDPWFGLFFQIGKNDRFVWKSRTDVDVHVFTTEHTQFEEVISSFLKAVDPLDPHFQNATPSQPTGGSKTASLGM
jgi:hypothetical protein